MSQEAVLEIANRAIMVTLMVAGPMLIAGLVVGLAVSIIQAVTQIHEMTLTFIPKILAIILTMIILMPWMMTKLIGFTTTLFNSIPTFSQ